MNAKKSHIIQFSKMHGCGNDYIYVNTMQYKVPSPSATAILISDRHKGIGSDGLVLIGKSPIPEADYSMRIFNADGSEAMMCGNASRCIGKYLYERGLTQQKEIRLLTLSGIKTLWLNVVSETVETVTVDMLEPKLQDEQQYIPSQDLIRGTFVSMGNPHYVIFTDNVDQVGDIGPLLEHHPSFPQRCNIEFANINADWTDTVKKDVFNNKIKVVTGKAGRKSTIVMDGGTLSIEWRETDQHVYMTGPASFVFEGEIEID